MKNYFKQKNIFALSKGKSESSYLIKSKNYQGLLEKKL